MEPLSERLSADLRRAPGATYRSDASAMRALTRPKGPSLHTFSSFRRDARALSFDLSDHVERTLHGTTWLRWDSPSE